MGATQSTNEAAPRGAQEGQLAASTTVTNGSAPAAAAAGHGAATGRGPRGCSIDFGSLVSKPEKLTLFATDTCPFAQRTWIALLEKEDNPFEPKLFDLKLVNAYDKSVATNAEFLSVTPGGMVPAALHRDHKFFNSLLLNEYVEEAIHPKKSLVPATPEGKWKMRLFIEKNTPLTEAIMPLIQARTSDAKILQNNKVLELVRVFESYLAGPFAMGDQFTLADIAFVSVFERLITVGGHYTGFAIPTTAEYAKTNTWWANVIKRDSVGITRGNRTAASLSLYPAESKTRDAYLIEMMEPYTFGLFALAREAWATAPAGKRVFTTELLQKYKAAEETKTA